MQDYGDFKTETSHHIMHHTHIVKFISYNLHHSMQSKVYQ